MNKVNYKYLIFDFDGVIADSIGAVAKFEHQTVHNQLTLEEVLEKLKTNDESSNFLHPITDTVKIEHRKKFIIDASKYLLNQEIPLFLDFLKQIHEIKNTKLAIVTSNSRELVEHLLKDIEHNFEYILGAEDDYLKSDKIQFICNKWGIKIEDIIYFTDTQRDVYQLENYISKNQIYGCAWGWHGYERLAKVLPEKNILKNFADIHKIEF